MQNRVRASEPFATGVWRDPETDTWRVKFRKRIIPLTFEHESSAAFYLRSAIRKARAKDAAAYTTETEF